MANTRTSLEKELGPYGLVLAVQHGVVVANGGRDSKGDVVYTAGGDPNAELDLTQLKKDVARWLKE